jgi:phosphatidylglycerophosphatase A
MSTLEHDAWRLLEERGVYLEHLIELVFHLQEKFISNLEYNTVARQVQHVMTKRDIQHAVVTGIVLDKLAEQNKLEQPLQAIVERDEGLYGIDEILALAIVNIYGSIGLTNFGYLDRTKPKILAQLNDKSNGCHTFLDDLVAALAAAASSRLAHELSGSQ